MPVDRCKFGTSAGTLPTDQKIHTIVTVLADTTISAMTDGEDGFAETFVGDVLPAGVVITSPKGITAFTADKKVAMYLTA